MAEDLASMNEKQRAKEFKAVAKGIRSKDISVKEPAFTKLYANRSYLFDGDCLRPLFETLIPKKGAYEPCLANIVAIEKVFRSFNLDELNQLFMGVLNTGTGTGTGTGALQTGEGVGGGGWGRGGGSKSLAVFQTLSNLISYKEEVKLPKPKKGEPQEVVIPPENEQVVIIRNKAIESFSIFCKAIDVGPDSDALQEAAITTIPNLLINQMAALNLTLSNISSKDESIKKRSIDETKLILSTLTRCLRFRGSPDYSTQFISLSPQWMPLMTSYLAEESLYLPTLQVIRQAALNKSVVQLISDNNFLSDIVLVLENITLKMEAFNVPKEAAAPAVDPKAKAPPPKKDDKKGKGAGAEAPPVDGAADAMKDAKIYYVACARNCGEILKLCFEQRIVMPDIETAVKIATALNKFIRNSSVPEICRSNEFSKDDGVGTVIIETLNFLLAGLGSMSAISEPIRYNVCSGVDDIVKVLVEAMQNSASIIGYDASSSSTAQSNDLLRYLSQFRDHLEKTILCLVSSHASNLELCLSVRSDYWPVASSYITHLVNIEKFFSLFVDMATQTGDVNLSDRAMRLVAFFMYTLTDKDKASIPTLFKFDAAFASKLSIVCHARATSTANGLKLQFEGKTDNDLSNSNLTNKDGADTENLGKTSPDHALYYSLLILVTILEVSPDIINAYCNKDRIVVLREVLYFSGPTVVPATLSRGNLGECNPEYEVALRNAWNYDWNFRLNGTDPQHEAPNKPFLRPLIIDVLTKICESDKVFRTYEGTVPVAPTKDVFKSASKTNDSVMTVIKYSADVVVSILLARVKVVNNTISSRGTNVNKLLLEKNSDHPNYWSLEIYQLLKSSLKFMISVAKAGSLGSYAILESIANSAKSSVSISGPVEYGGDYTALLTPLEWLRSCLGIDRIVDASTFSRSLFFNDFFHLNESASCESSMQSNTNSWPYVTLILSLLVIVSDDLVHSDISYLAIEALESFCEDKLFEASCQPVVCDILSAVLLSFGGASILSGYFGKFGRLTSENPEINTRGVSFLLYLLDRGSSREKFWTEYKEANAAASATPAIDPKTGKPIAAAAPKKDEKKKDEKKAPAGKDAKGAGIAAAVIVEEVKYNIEPEDPFIDPNRGPSKEFWLKVVDNCANDSYNIVDRSSGLISAIHASLPEISTYLIDSGVDIDYCESNGRNALIFAFIFRDYLVADKLVKGNAELDTVDVFGNPCIKYAFSSLDEASFNQIYQHNSDSYSEVPRKFISGNVYFGSNELFSILQNTRVDVHVSDSVGNFPVHYALGLCETELCIAGSTITLRNNAYSKDWSAVEQSMRNLVAMNANVNQCNKMGLSPLHFTAVKGDATLAKYLLSKNAKPNVYDHYGYLPLHYICQCCPESNIELFDKLFEATINRPIESFSFSDIRSGKSKEDKIAIDIQNAFETTFGSELNPATRLSSNYPSCAGAILTFKETILHMCLSPNELTCNVSDANLFSNNKMQRILLALHIIKLGERENCLNTLLTSKGPYGFTLLHAASILLKGVEPHEPLPEKQLKVRKQSRRVTEAEKSARQKELHARRLFVNEEARLVDVILEYFYSSSYDCWHGVSLFNYMPTTWTPLHAAICNDNGDLCKTLLDKFPFIPKDVVMVLAALPKTSIETVQIVINAVCQSKDLDSFGLNSFDNRYDVETLVERLVGVAVLHCTPLHLAVKLNNSNFIRVACSKLQFNVNAYFDSSVPTAFVTACFPASPTGKNLVSCFESAFDRMDLLEHFCTTLHQGRQVNCIEAAIYAKDVNLLELFIKYRQNDVLHVVLNEGGNRSSSMLLELELEQINLVKQVYGERLDGIDSSSSSNNSSSSNDDGGGGQWSEQADYSCRSTYYSLVPLESASTDTIDACDRNCKVLQVLLPLVNESNLIASCAHAHRCFFDNIMYRDFGLTPEVLTEKQRE